MLYNVDIDSIRTSNNILLVPFITKNLISVSQFSKDKHVYFLFSVDKFHVKSQEIDVTLLKGHIDTDGIYEFHSIALSHPTKPYTFSSSSLLVKINVPCINSKLPSTWHLRLGHPSFNSLRLVLQAYNIPFTSKENNVFCTSCCMGKARRLYFSALHTTFSTPLELIYWNLWSTHLELIYCDLWGSSLSLSTIGFSYYMSFVDAYSKFTCIYFLKFKYGALNIFKQLSLWLNFNMGYPIKVVQSD